MSNVAEFIEIRKSIEALASQITLCVEQKVALDSRRHLDEANRQLALLLPMVDNDVQEIVAGRLSRQLADLGAKIEKMAAKLPVRKRPEGKSSARKSTPKEKMEWESAKVNAEDPQITIFERS